MIALALLGCSAPPSAQGAKPASGAAVATRGVVTDVSGANGPLAAIDWANRRYELTMFEGEGEMDFAVVDGVYESSTPGDPNFEWLAVQPPVYGDLDGDGVAEAAIVVVYNNGRERFDDKLLVYTASPDGPRRLGIVYGGNRGDGGLGPIAIRDGALRVTRFRGEPSDPPCQPSQQVIETWRWDGRFFTETESARRPETRPRQGPQPRCAR